ncbi:DUF5714 domain-containing protein [Desulfosporosinus burensis]
MIEFKDQTTVAGEPIKHSEGCLICGKELIYAETGTLQKCTYCGKEQHSSIICPDGHFICDECHRADASQMIEIVVEKTTQTNPIELAREIMGTPAFHMHGPEHHQLIPATLLATLRNLGIAIEPAQIQDAIVRSRQLPGGICGSWGSCGVAIGAGIGLSVLRRLTALTKEGWGETNRDTADILQRVGAYGGPRCCKRSTYSALLAAIDILEREEVAIFPQEAHATPICKDFWRNQQCLKAECPYYPQKKL